MTQYRARGMETVRRIGTRPHASRGKEGRTEISERGVPKRSRASANEAGFSSPPLYEGKKRRRNSTSKRRDDGSRQKDPKARIRTNSISFDSQGRGEEGKKAFSLP